MAAQLQQVLSTIEAVVIAAGYQCSDMMRLTIYTTATPKLFTYFELYTAWVQRHAIQATATLREVGFLAYEGLEIELEVTAVR